MNTGFGAGIVIPAFFTLFFDYNNIMNIKFVADILYLVCIKISHYKKFSFVESSYYCRSLLQNT